VKARTAIGGAVLAVGVLVGSWLRAPERPAQPAQPAFSIETAAGQAPVARPTAPRLEVTTSPAHDLADGAPAAALSIEPPSPVHALTRALATGDDHDLVQAVEAVVDAHAVDALPALSSIELRNAPHSAPAVIEGIAALAREAGPRERREAASTLSRWFRQERGREGIDAAGNTTTLIDALAETGHREAVDALVTALDEHALPLNNETLIVQRLAELRQVTGKPAVARFLARVAAMPRAEGVDEELRNEAMTAARDALERLGSGG